MLIGPGQLVLFQGDSITDAGRDRGDPNALGSGYAMIAAGWLSAAHPKSGIRFMNRGVSGDRVKDLRARWHRDCLELKPDWVSVMIGINDCWRRYDSGDSTGAEDFENAYREILGEVKKGPGSKVILMEPFVVPVTEEQKRWHEDLDPKTEAVRRLAKEFGARLIPLGRIMAEACRARPSSFWAGDGVHPTPAGHALIARAWLKTAGAI